MSNSPDTNPDRSSSQKAICFLAKAFQAGRPIIPFLGAGVSAGSGFPLTETIREYLCKTKFFIRYSVYRRLLGQDIPPLKSLSANDLEFNPGEYLVQFGWPDFNRLTADLWRYADNPFARSHSHEEEDPWWTRLRAASASSNTDEELCQRFSPDTAYLDRCFDNFEDAVRAVQSGSSKFGIRDHDAQSRLEQFRNATGFKLFNDRIRDGKPIWAWDRNRVASIIEFILLELLKVEDFERTKQIESKVWEHGLHIRGDWFKLLHDLVEGRRGLADELLAQLNRHRTPSLAHLMLAHLAKRLGWRLLLTLNHDSLVEKAFSTEGLIPKVFDVNAVAGVPDPALLRREPLSLVKLHGSAFGLRLGESTNDELDDTTRERLLHYIPHNAILLVIGFSGYERRMMSVIESIASAVEKQNQDGRTIVWMYWGAPEEPVNRLRDRLIQGGNRGTQVKSGTEFGMRRERPIELFRLDDAGTFLKGLYQRITRSLPSTKTAYQALPKRLTAGSGRSPVGKRQEVVQLFVRDTLIPAQGFNVNAVFAPGGAPVERDSVIPAACSAPRPEWPPYKGLVKRELSRSTYLSTAMSHFVGNCRGYDTIWVDLEDHHTVTGVVSEIISQLRVFDPTLPPLVLPVAGPSVSSTAFDNGIQSAPKAPIFDRAARYLHRAIRRGRYVLAFGSLEGFGRPQTAHHGLTSISESTLNDLKPILAEMSKSPDDSVQHDSWQSYEHNEAEFERRLALKYRQNKFSSLYPVPSRARFERELRNYTRLLDLLDFFRTLLCVSPAAPLTDRRPSNRLRAERGLNPLMIDWYCCFAIDVPQPRHLDPPKIGPRGIADLSFYAFSRFCRDISLALGCNLHLTEQQFERHTEKGGATAECVTFRRQETSPGASTPQNASSTASTSALPPAADPAAAEPFSSLNEPPRVGLTRFDVPPENPHGPVSPPSDGPWIDETCRLLKAIDDNSDPGNTDPLNSPRIQEFLDAIIKYSLIRFRNDHATKVRGGDSVTTFDDAQEQMQRDNFSKDKDAVTLFILMCVFRRPRNLSSLVAVIERLQAMIAGRTDAESVVENSDNGVSGTAPDSAFDVDGSLDLLSRHHLVHLSEGELYFIPEHVHQVVYKLLSTPLRLTQWRAFDREEEGEEWANHLRADKAWLEHGGAAPAVPLRAAWLGRVHSSIGRDYYIHVWQRSHDTSAFFEYLYHRLASLRYLMMLRARMEMGDKTAAPLCCGEATPGKPVNLLMLLLGKAADDWELPSPVTWSFFRDRTDHIRSEYVSALINVLERERSTILTSATGHTWLNWVRQMLEVDVAEIFAREVDQNNTERFPCTEFRAAWFSEYKSRHTTVGLPFLTIQHRFEILLLDIDGTLNREIGAFDDCVTARADLLKRILFSDKVTEPVHGADPVADLLARVANPQSFIHDEWIESLSERLDEFAGITGLVHMIDGAVVDIAASRRHLHDNAYEIADALLAAFIGLQLVFDLALKELHRSKRFALAAVQEARAAMKVAAIHWEFEKYRLKTDGTTRRRFELVDFLGRPKRKWDANHGPLNYLKLMHRAERQLYGVPFQHEGDFVLQVSRFAALRATLLPLLGTEEGLNESLRMFEEAESGLDADHSAHMFHQIIIHTQRAYTLMLVADASMRRYRQGKAGSPGVVLPIDRYKMEIVPNALLVSVQRLAEARAELLSAEEILGGGRRNVRIWLRLYHARAQLAVEELLRLCLVVEFDSSSLGKEHTFVAEIQEWLLFGLEAIRGAMDCTVYDESEREDSASAIKLYLQLFVAGRLALQGFSAARDSETRRSASIWQAIMASKRLTGEQEFLERWEALNETVGLSRVFRSLDERRRPQRIAAGDNVFDQSKWLIWKDIVALCDASVFALGRDGSTEHAETLRECALHKMESLLGDHPIARFGKVSPSNKPGNCPWLINVILDQRHLLHLNESGEGETRATVSSAPAAGPTEREQPSGVAPSATATELKKPPAKTRPKKPRPD